MPSALESVTCLPGSPRERYRRVGSTRNQAKGAHLGRMIVESNVRKAYRWSLTSIAPILNAYTWSELECGCVIW